MAEWLLLSRGADGRLTGTSLVKELSAVARHFGVGAGVATVPYSDEAYGRFVEGASVEVRRDGVTVSGGPIVEIRETWPGDIKVSWVGDELILQDAFVVPDPQQAPDDQVTALYWERTGVASTVMTQMITEQLGPTAHAAFRVPGLTVAPDPVLGASAKVLIKYGKPNMLAELRALAVASGLDLGLRVSRVGGAPLVTIVPSRDVASTIRFSADLRNLVSYEFTRTAPKVTRVIANGQDPTSLPTQAYAEATDPVTAGWDRRAWTYVDEGETIDATLLAASAANALAEGKATVSLTCTLQDTETVAFGRDWELGDRVTVYVGRPGGPKVAVVDVVREIAFTYGENGESIIPAIGTDDATALPFSPTQQTLNQIKARLAGLERRN